MSKGRPGHRVAASLLFVAALAGRVLVAKATSHGKYRLYVSDPQQGYFGFFPKGTENGVSALFATRLKVVNGQITGGTSGLPY